jgi:zinc transporter, ZIP family
MRFDPALQLLLWSVLAALAAGLGPLFIGRKYLGWANAFAAGMMLGAAYLVMDVGLVRAALIASGAAALGTIATFSIHVLLGVGSRPVLAYLASAVHSAPEGIAMGAAMALSPAFGAFVVLTFAIHNISESAGVISQLEMGGQPRARATLLAIGARSTQVLFAWLAYWVAQYADATLSMTLGFAFGALVYLCVAELLPESYRTAGRTSIAVVASVAAGVVALLGGRVQ